MCVCVAYAGLGPAHRYMGYELFGPGQDFAIAKVDTVGSKAPCHARPLFWCMIWYGMEEVYEGGFGPPGIEQRAKEQSDCALTRACVYIREYM